MVCNQVYHIEPHYVLIISPLSPPGYKVKAKVAYFNPSTIPALRKKEVNPISCRLWASPTVHTYKSHCKFPFFASTHSIPIIYDYMNFPGDLLPPHTFEVNVCLSASIASNNA